MTQRRCSWILCNSLFKGLKYQRIVVTVSDDVRYNPAIVEIKDCTQVNFVYLYSDVIFKFCNIGQSFLVWSFR